MLSLDYLDAVFPDARFVMTHRDPTDVMLSVADVYADIVGGFSDHVDRRYLGELNVHQWSVGMERVCKFRDSGADHRFFDIDFRAMAADPIGEVRALYALARRAGRARSSKRACGRGGRTTPRTASRTSKADAADFGLDSDRVRPQVRRRTSNTRRRWTARTREG